MLKTENARPSTWIYVDESDRDLTSVVGDLQRAVAKQVPLSPGVSIASSRQFEYPQHPLDKLKLVVPATLIIIFVILSFTFGRFDDAALIMGTPPLALSVAVWFLYILGFHKSVA